MAGLPLRQPSGPFPSGDPASCDTGQCGNQPTACSDAIACPPRLGCASAPCFSVLSLPSSRSFVLAPAARGGLGLCPSPCLQSWAPGLRGYCLSREGPAILTPLTPPFSQAQQACGALLTAGEDVVADEDSERAVLGALEAHRKRLKGSTAVCEACVSWDQGLLETSLVCIW